jgi:spore coat polysaccharide biosynthesis protein SpsF (cytidylyltransferase family)
MRFGGEELIGHVVSACSSVRNADGLSVVTSVDPSDDPIEEWCQKRKVNCWRGSLHDVARRMVEAAQGLHSEAFVRISGDSPMMDPTLIETAVELYAYGGVDVVSNIHPRTFPPGQSIEVVRVACLAEIIEQEEVSASDREHVTPALYREGHRLRLRAMSPDQYAGAVLPKPPYPSLTVDTAAEAVRFSEVIEVLNGQAAWPQGWVRCVEIVRDLDAATAPGRFEERG